MAMIQQWNVSDRDPGLTILPLQQSMDRRTADNAQKTLESSSPESNKYCRMGCRMQVVTKAGVVQHLMQIEKPSKLN
jgi:hypothetical protein